MASQLTGRKFVISYAVFCLDVWGHGPDECGDEYNCPCIITDDEGNRVHDPDEAGHDCDAEFTVNDRSECGSLEVEADEEEHNVGTPRVFREYAPTDEDIVQALVDQGHLKSHVTPADIDIDGEWDATLFIEQSKDGYPLFQLEFESAVEKLD